MADATRQLALRSETIEGQINSLRQSLTQNAKQQRALVERLTERSGSGRSGGDAVFQWLESQIEGLREEKEEAEKAIEKLQREKLSIERSQPSVKDMRGTLEHVFKNFGKVEESQQRSFYREIFEKIEVCAGNLVRLKWRFTDCGFGGKRFGLREEWGG